MMSFKPTTNIIQGQRPKAFGGSAIGIQTLHGYSGGDGPRPVVLGTSLLPDKRGNNPSLSPFFNTITLNEMIDSDYNCLGVSSVPNYFGSNQPSTNTSSLGGVSAVPKPFAGSRTQVFGLAHTKRDIEGSKMKILRGDRNFNL